MIIALEEAKHKLIAMRADINELGQALRIEDLKAKKAELEAQMRRGAEEASYYARRTLGKVQKKLGFVKI